MRLISASFATILLAPALALAAGSSSQLVWIDLNNDQLDDLLRYERGGTAQYLVNLGQGQFAEAPELASVQAGIEYAVAADLNSDQRAELILTTADGTAVLRYDSGTPQLMTRIDATGPIEVRDADGDRRADLVIGDQIHRQNAQGELVPVALPEFESASSSTVTDVGIGESAPPSTDSWFKEFHKSNPLPDGVIYLENSSSGRTLLVENSSSGDAIEASASGTGTALRIQSPTSAPSRGEFDFNAGSGGLTVNSHTGGTWADISFQTNGNTRMFVESAGNVGIGTTDPSYKLEIAGGGVRAEAGDAEGSPISGYSNCDEYLCIASSGFSNTYFGGYFTSGGGPALGHYNSDTSTYPLFGYGAGDMGAYLGGYVMASATTSASGTSPAMTPQWSWQASPAPPPRPSSPARSASSTAAPRSPSTPNSPRPSPPMRPCAFT